MAKTKISRQVRLYLILLVVGGLLLACNIFNNSVIIDPTITPSPQKETPQEHEPTPTQELPQGPSAENPGQCSVEGWVLIDQGGVQFCYDPNVIQDILAETIAAEAEGGYIYPHPAYVQYTLGLDNGLISVVDRTAYEDSYSDAAGILTDLQDLIASQNADGLNCIPDPPLIHFSKQCGHQQFFSNLVFTNFQNGSGVRFVTVYAIQNTTPVLNEYLDYSFQGMTNDHQCYVQVGFNPTHILLDGVTDYPPEIYSDMTGTAAKNYFSDYAAKFNANPDGFTPSLDQMDQIISSFEVVSCSGG